MIVPELQSRIETANMQTRFVQPGKYGSVTRTEDRQPITSQNNQEIQEKWTPPGPDQIVADAI
jgi:hypothetical protein